MAKRKQVRGKKKTGGAKKPVEVQQQVEQRSVPETQSEGSDEGSEWDMTGAAAEAFEKCEEILTTAVYSLESVFDSNDVEEEELVQKVRDLMYEMEEVASELQAYVEENKKGGDDGMVKCYRDNGDGNVVMTKRKRGEVF